MSLEQEILKTVRALPADKQQAVLDHARHLHSEISQLRRPPWRSLIAASQWPLKEKRSHGKAGSGCTFC